MMLKMRFLRIEKVKFLLKCGFLRVLYFSGITQIDFYEPTVSQLSPLFSYKLLGVPKVMDNKEFNKQLEKGTQKFAIDIISLSSLPNTPEEKVIRNQITKSGTRSCSIPR